MTSSGDRTKHNGGNGQEVGARAPELGDAAATVALECFCDSSNTGCIHAVPCHAAFETKGDEGEEAKKNMEPATRGRSELQQRFKRG